MVILKKKFKNSESHSNLKGSNKPFSFSRDIYMFLYERSDIYEDSNYKIRKTSKISSGILC